MSRRVVIVGGGITGLSAAYQVTRSDPSARLTLLENRQRLGGNILTERRDGFVLDAGPDSFLSTKLDAINLCSELGLSQELITPQARGRDVYMVHAGRLTRMPAGMVLAVPTRIGPLLGTPLLSRSAKLRVLGDLLQRSRSNGSGGHGDESIQSFITRHFGPEAAQSIAAPLLGGIYAGNIGELSMAATFPQLVQLEREHGSVIFGFFKRELELAKAANRHSESRGAANGASAMGTRLAELGHLLSWFFRPEGQRPSPFLSFRNGLGSLIDALARALPAGSTRLASAVKAVAPDETGLRVVLESGEVLSADAVILAVPAHAAARIAQDPELCADLGAIRYESTATVFLALRRSAIQHPLDASGFVVAPNLAKILAATWVTSKWAERAPNDCVLIRAFVGGARDPKRVLESTDEELVALARSELETLMGNLGEPLFTRVFRHVDASPQPLVGHRELLRRIEQNLAHTPGLYLAGAAYDGIGIPDCIRQGRAAAERALARP
jgi:protoporphyrinogen/coproporphyrinogen III oxidase